MKKVLNNLRLCLILLCSTLPVFGQNEPELFPVNDRKVGYIGYYLADGTNVVKPQFCTGTNAIDGYYVVSKGEHTYDENGNRNEAHVPGSERFALLDAKGNFVIGFERNYDYIGIHNGMIEVGKNDLYGILSNKNEIIVPLEYDYLDIQNQEIIIAKKNRKTGVITKDNKIILPFIYDDIFGFTAIKSADNFYVIVLKTGEMGVIDKANKIIIPFSDAYIRFVTERSVGIKNGTKYSLVDYNLKKIIPNDFDEMYLVDLDKNKIYAKDKDYGYYFTIDGKLLKKEKLPAINEAQKTDESTH